MASRDGTGTISAPRPVKLKLPKKGQRKVYLCTSAQSNTSVHPELWRNLLALAEHDNAEIIVGSFTYSKPRHEKGQKKTAKETAEVEEWWDPVVLPYLRDFSVELAPGLVWCGELNLLPTAVNPISGLESYTGRDSAILPHAKFALRSIPSPKLAGTKMIYTSGTVTLRNYLEKKAGQKAKFHHGYGALIVEVTHEGHWFVRQINSDSEGVFYDLDRKVEAGRVSHGHRPEALVWGDIHVRQMQSAVTDLCWAAGGALDALRPRRQILHDVLDFRSQNHHDRDDPWKTDEKHVAGGTSVAAEIAEAADFVAEAHRPWLETVVVCSNHDVALVRWLKESNGLEDPENAVLWLQAHLASYMARRSGDKDWYAVEWAFRQARRLPKGVRFLRRDEEYIVCSGANGGIELGHHGDVGPNGARGSLDAFAKMGRKVVIGHSHAAGIKDGACQVGVMAALDQGYNAGPSSWSHSFCLVYPNGKRAIVTIWKGKWHG